MNMKPQRGKTPAKKNGAKRNQQTDPVEVFCRLRPLEDPSSDSCIKVLGPTTIQLTANENTHAFKTGGILKETQNTFSFVFDEFSSQKAIFDHVALPLVEDVLHGKNALLFAYGITGSGKTYTMTANPQDPGVLPRCLDVIFNSIRDLQAKKYVFKPDKMNGFEVQTEVDAMLERQKRDLLPRLHGGMAPKTPGPSEKERNDARLRDTSRVQDLEEDNNYGIFLSYVEIYNNYTFDLLEDLAYDPITGYKPPQSKNLREDNTGKVYVSGANIVEVKSTEEAYELIAKGQKRRKVAHTALNTESSRSHSVLNLYLVQAPLDVQGNEVLQDKEKLVVSQLSLVDLAGSERTVRTNNQGARLREAGNINQSLMVLRTCIEVLRENQKSGEIRMVPYRDSRLTNLFKSYFSGEGKVRMVVCVNPRAQEYDETLHVMKFAEMTQEVQVVRQQRVQFNSGLTPGRRRMNQQYKEEISKAVSEDQPLPDPIVYSLGPGFPSTELHEASDECTLQFLAEYLEQRKRRRSTLMTDMAAKEAAFRERLLETERENLELREHVKELEGELNSRNSECGKAQRRVRGLEKAVTDMKKEKTAVEIDREELMREVNNKDWRIQQASSERDRIRQDYKAKLALTEQSYNRHMEHARKRMEEEKSSQLRAKQQKIDLVRNIINGNNSEAESANGVGTRQRSHTVSSRMYPARSEPDLSSTGVSASTPKPAPRTHVRAMTIAAANKAVPRTTRKEPPPVKPKPQLLPRYHRRSKSSHEVWLEHKPANNVDTGLLSQPNMKKKRSVTNLREKDTKDVDRYLLTHQGLDSDGEFATKHIKGDVHTTAGGGTSVVFTDVEKIKQRSPGDRKRRSPTLFPEDFEGEWTDTEDRCKIAVEHHGHLKRIKTSAV